MEKYTSLFFGLSHDGISKCFALFDVTGNNAIVAIMISGICSLQEKYFVVLHKYKIRGGDIGISRAHENEYTKE